MSEINFICSVSGGLTSFEALRRTIEAHGRDSVAAVFADVGSIEEDGEIVCGEDRDLFRFLDQTEQILGLKVQRIRHPKYLNIWDAFFGERFLGNTRIDPCSKFLKRMVIDKWISDHCPDATRVLGFSWLEFDRAKRFATHLPNSYFPLCHPPYVTNEDIADWLLARGIRRPALYDEGFSHNNCGGFCVKMGLGQAHDLWRLRIKVWMFNERMEARFRDEINPQATIFRKDREPVTMASLRSLFESGYVPKTSMEGCGGRCMMPGEDLFDEFSGIRGDPRL